MRGEEWRSGGVEEWRSEGGVEQWVKDEGWRSEGWRSALGVAQ